MAKIFLAMILALSATAFAKGQISSVNILPDAITTGPGDAFSRWHPQATFHAYGTAGSGTGAVTIFLQGSNIASDTTRWVKMGEVVLSLSTTVATGALTIDAPWRFVRGNITLISGSGPTINVFMGAMP